MQIIQVNGFCSFLIEPIGMDTSSVWFFFSCGDEGVIADEDLILNVFTQSHKSASLIISPNVEKNNRRKLMIITIYNKNPIQINPYIISLNNNSESSVVQTVLDPLIKLLLKNNI